MRKLILEKHWHLAIKNITESMFFYLNTSFFLVSDLSHLYSLI